MAYSNKRVYRCDICGTEGAERLHVNIYGTTYHELPYGWVGSEDRFGSCVCDRCAAAMDRLRSERCTDFGN